MFAHTTILRHVLSVLDPGNFVGTETHIRWKAAIPGVVLSRDARADKNMAVSVRDAARCPVVISQQPNMARRV